MSFSVEVEPPAKKEFARLPPHIQQQIARRLEALEDNPFPIGAKKLERPLVGLRIRSGNYRVIYTVDIAAQVVRVKAVGHRKDVYR